MADSSLIERVVSGLDSSEYDPNERNRKRAETSRTEPPERDGEPDGSFLSGDPPGLEPETPLDWLEWLRDHIPEPVNWIPEFEGLYAISESGRVWRLSRQSNANGPPGWTEKRGTGDEIDLRDRERGERLVRSRSALVSSAFDVDRLSRLSERLSGDPEIRWIPEFEGLYACIDTGRVFSWSSGEWDELSGSGGFQLYRNGNIERSFSSSEQLIKQVFNEQEEDSGGIESQLTFVD